MTMIKFITTITICIALLVFVLYAAGNIIYHSTDITTIEVFCTNGFTKYNGTYQILNSQYTIRTRSPAYRLTLADKTILYLPVVKCAIAPIKE